MEGERGGEGEGEKGEGAATILFVVLPVLVHCLNKTFKNFLFCL